MPDAHVKTASYRTITKVKRLEPCKPSAEPFLLRSGWALMYLHLLGLMVPTHCSQGLLLVRLALVSIIHYSRPENQWSSCMHCQYACFGKGMAIKRFLYNISVNLFWSLKKYNLGNLYYLKTMNKESFSFYANIFLCFVYSTSNIYFIQQNTQYMGYIYLISWYKVYGICELHGWLKKCQKKGRFFFNSTHVLDIVVLSKC